MFADLVRCSRKVVQDNCWLANTTGRWDGFFPLDQLQEHSNLWIKVIYSASGPNASWDYLKRITPLIPTLRAVADHIEDMYGTTTSGKHHHQVDHQKDIEVLLPLIRDDDLHSIHKDGRTSRDGSSVDVISTGVLSFVKGNTLQRWHETRNVYLRRHGHIFEGKAWEHSEVAVSDAPVVPPNHQVPEEISFDVQLADLLVDRD